MAYEAARSAGLMHASSGATAYCSGSLDIHPGQLHTLAGSENCWKKKEIKSCGLVKDIRSSRCWSARQNFLTKQSFTWWSYRVIHGFCLYRSRFQVAGRWLINLRSEGSSSGFSCFVSVQNGEFVTVTITLNSGDDTARTLRTYLIALIFSISLSNLQCSNQIERTFFFICLHLAQALDAPVKTMIKMEEITELSSKSQRLTEFD